MGVRTFSRSDWNAAQDAWAEGEFSDEWKVTRHAAAMRGMLFPPSGAKWDSWEEESPSQRSILIRAIREHPKLLAECVGRSSSWDQVINLLIRRITSWREEVADAERETIRQRADDQPTGRESAMALKAILTRIGDS